MGKRGILSNIVFALLVVLIGSFVVYGSGGLGALFKGADDKAISDDFTVTQSGKEIKESTTGVMLVWGAVNQFQVSDDYNLRIKANTINDFEYVLDGAYKTFSMLGECVSGFDVEKNDEVFTVGIGGNTTMEDILMRIHGGGIVEELPLVNLYEKDYFLIEVESVKTGKVIEIGFRKHFTIKLDKEGIVF